MDRPIMTRTHGFRELPREEQLSQFYRWLPLALHDAPGIRWDDLPREVMAYAVRLVGETLDAAPLAVAAAVMTGWVQPVTQIQTLSNLAQLLVTLRKSAGMKEVADLSQEQIWRTFAVATERTGKRSKQLAFYSSLSSRYIPAYLQRLSPDERQRMQAYTLPALPPGFIMQHGGDAQMNTVISVEQHCTVEVINEKVSAAKQKWLKKRWEIVRAAMLNPWSVAAIAADVGASPQLVLDVLTSYNRGGVSALETQGRGGGRRHAYLNDEEERAFMAPLLQSIRSDGGLSFREAKQAFEARVKRKVNVATVYDLFARYGVHRFSKMRCGSRHRQGKAGGQTTAELSGQVPEPPASRHRPPTTQLL
jgi:hypothetical protein